MNGLNKKLYIAKERISKLEEPYLKKLLSKQHREIKRWKICPEIRNMDDKTRSNTHLIRGLEERETMADIKTKWLREFFRTNERQNDKTFGRRTCIAMSHFGDGYAWELCHVKVRYCHVYQHGWLEIIMLRDISQTEKDKNRVISPRWTIKQKVANKWNKQEPTQRHRQQKGGYRRGKGVEGSKHVQTEGNQPAGGEQAIEDKYVQL